MYNNTVLLLLLLFFLLLFEFRNNKFEFIYKRVLFYLSEEDKECAYPRLTLQIFSSQRYRKFQVFPMRSLLRYYVSLDGELDTSSYVTLRFIAN